MKLSWKLDTTYTDGSPFGQADYAGVELQIICQPFDTTKPKVTVPAVALPAAWNPGNAYSFVVDALQPPEGTLSFQMRTLATNGTPSDWSSAVSKDYKRTPKSPLALAVA